MPRRSFGPGAIGRPTAGASPPGAFRSLKMIGVSGLEFRVQNFGFRV